MDYLTFMTPEGVLFSDLRKLKSRLNKLNETKYHLTYLLTQKKEHNN